MALYLLMIYSSFLVGVNGGWCDNKNTAGQDLVSAYSRLPLSRRGMKHQSDIKHNLPVEEMIKSEGYPVETYYVTTQDGYVLALHRIPYGKTNNNPTGREAVLVQHGLLCSSADWVMSTPEKGLGYMLAEAGYDVWLGNYRGNTYSRNHTTLDPDNGEGSFWDFTWDEMAKYDIPAMIEKVLEVSGKSELQYVGHSMGTTGFMAMHHYRTDVAAKVRLAHLLSPVAYVGTMESPIAWLAGLGPLLDGICTNILFVLCGYDEPQMNTTLLPTILHHTPAGASTSTILHYIQEVKSSK
ncbi:gastric triacylglycerol lipase isoform X2 [Eurytemora carolleeae]|uniref:gastric triacylglycerol lipase isoform X2 n=1 Tax=Eurytemora carolleeae TaxID=1294199 RepID=UPI000C76D524|nr:gastric triacylglycerol lipase isoform X2 [Eurytemora carolleeae]|eukprot:XP_023329827.1 gastric triacylglycerol lipase-like isoform X2 [Eurytemora affinis]